jgi:hypothetical protein
MLSHEGVELNSIGYVLVHGCIMQFTGIGKGSEQVV